jgi:hypothetical protein
LKKKKNKANKKKTVKPQAIPEKPQPGAYGTESNLIKKYCLSNMHFDGKRYHEKCYCILVSKNFKKLDTFKYVQGLRETNRNANISISDEENDFYMIKYKLPKYPDFQSSKRFKPKFLNKEFIDKIQIFEVKKKKIFHGKI